jgi:hypothetical protein
MNGMVAPDAVALPLPLAAPSPVKLAYTTRRAALDEAAELVTGAVVPRAGDLVLARVEQLGQHPRLELRDGRRAALFPGDNIVVCYGNRYAPDQFEAEVPGDLSTCHLVAAGGIASRMLSRHGSMGEPTRITPLGLLGDVQGRPLNVSRWAMRRLSKSPPRPLTVAVVGTTMNTGKTTMAADLVRGLCAAGYRVGAAKITGTGAGGDVWLLGDAGADPVFDFIDAGHASTYRVSAAAVERILDTLTGQLAAAGVGAIVLELADGIYQAETAALLCSPRFAGRIDRLMFAAYDAAGAVAGVAHLRALGYEVAALGGRISSSPLGAHEATLATGVAVLDSVALRDPGVLPGLAELGRLVPSG